MCGAGPRHLSYWSASLEPNHLRERHSEGMMPYLPTIDNRSGNNWPVWKYSNKDFKVLLEGVRLSGCCFVFVFFLLTKAAAGMCTQQLFIPYVQL